ncbi:MAG: hypothetical protein QME94_16710 [Anaerolineae bacterium]|nr:hypothetical protein [Anaerolineae bacterium]
MTDAEVEVVAVTGRCNAGLKVGDRFVLKGVEIIPEGEASICQVAFATVVTNSGRLRLQEWPIYVSCPDPGTGEGGNVILKLARV